MSRLEEIQTNSYEMQLKYLEEMKAKVDIAKTELEQSYISVIDCKSLFQEFKKENIEEIRSYKFSINSEVVSIKNSMKSLLQEASDIGLSDMKDFVGICERLNSLQKDGFFDRFYLTEKIIKQDSIMDGVT
jgi:hypothetical protein